MTKTEERIKSILADPCASYWLKDALNTALKRDPVDAMHDARLLANLMADRLADLS